VFVGEAEVTGIVRDVGAGMSDGGAGGICFA
jgi:hypothetical protein